MTLQEDELILSENRRCATLSKEPRYKERQRNRDRITEISELISSAIKEIDELEEAAADEEED